MSKPAPPEAKVFAVLTSGTVITGVFELLHQYWPAVQVPDAAGVAAIVTILSTAAAYLTRHTARPEDSGVKLVQVKTAQQPPSTTTGGSK